MFKEYETVLNAYLPVGETLDTLIENMYEEIAIEDEKERLHKLEVLKKVKRLLPAKKYRGLLAFLEYHHEGFLEGSFLGGDSVHDFQITNEPCAKEKQSEREFSLTIYISQWSVGMEGDSWNGIISVPLRDKLFFTFKYSC